MNNSVTTICSPNDKQREAIFRCQHGFCISKRKLFYMSEKVNIRNFATFCGLNISERSYKKVQGKTYQCAIAQGPVGHSSESTIFQMPVWFTSDRFRLMKKVAQPGKN